MLHSWSLTVRPWKVTVSPKRKEVFQPSFFRGELLNFWNVRFWGKHHWQILRRSSFCCNWSQRCCTSSRGLSRRRGLWVVRHITVGVTPDVAMENPGWFFPNSNSSGVFSHSKGFGTEWCCCWDTLWAYFSSSWWFQPIWKICSSKLGSSSPIFGVKIPKNIWVASTQSCICVVSYFIAIYFMYLGFLEGSCLSSNGWRSLRCHVSSK